MRQVPDRGPLRPGSLHALRDLLLCCCVLLFLSTPGRAGAQAIVVYGDERLPPYEFVEDGVPKGILVDMWSAIGKVLERPIDYRLADWSVAQANVRNGLGDALSGMAATPERAALYGFTQTTLKVSFSLFVRSADAAQFDARPLDDRRIGVSEGGLPRIHFTRHDPGVALVVVADTVEGIRRLLRGDIDAFATVTATGNYYLRELNIAGVTPLPKPFAALDTSIAIPVGDPALLADVDRALAQIKADGTFDRIIDKWAGAKVHVFSEREIWRIGAALGSLAVMAALLVSMANSRARQKARGLQLVSDITELKRTQEALERANIYLLNEMGQRQTVQRELEAANAGLRAKTREVEAANQAKTLFLAGVSHELRTPLHTLLGFVRFARQDVAGETRNRLLIAERSGIQLMKLIDELIEFNRGAGHLLQVHAEPVPLAEILAQIERSGKLMAVEQHNTYLIDTATDLPDGIVVDEPRLLQVLQNLVGNACKYTQRGTVALRVARAGDDAAASATCRLRFAVDDTGPGIADADLAHIFDAFARGTVHHRQPGLGLGLAIAQQWVRAMGGEIQVRSEIGRGSSFFFTLTLGLAPPGSFMPAPADTETGARLTGTPRTVLVADDVAENRMLLRDMCERWGFEVLEAADGDEALEACMTAARPIDAVLVDQFMPRVGGWEFLRRVRAAASLAHLPIALISASEMQRPQDLPGDVDFDLVLDKPLDDAALAGFLFERTGGGEAIPDDGAGASRNTPRFDIALAEAERAKFLEMVDLGRVEAIAAWAQELAAADPGHAEFAARLVRLCRTADLAAIEQIAERIGHP